MDIKDAIKTLVLNLICVILIIVSVLGVKSSYESAFMLSLFIVMFIVSLIAIIWGNIKLFSKDDPAKEDETEEKKMIAEISKYMNTGCRETRVAAASLKRQIVTFQDRKNVLMSLLNDYFSEDDSLYSYTGLIERAKRSLYENVELCIKRISIFNYQEYASLMSHNGAYSADTYNSKMAQYKEHIDYINKIVDTNDKLLIEFDNLITEVSRLNESDDANDLSMITDTVNAMKQLHFSEDDELSGLKTKY